MYESLKKNSPYFHLYIFGFDDLTCHILGKLNLESVSVISLKEFETEELKKIKQTRTKAEYCWTCTPSVISYVIEKFNVSDCTYIDSDLFFYTDPSFLISELNLTSKNVLITEHRYSFLPRLYEEKRAGRFCVQFITFTSEKDSLKVLNRWREQCIDWCYFRHEDGKFGDQKYLDEWPELYTNVHILNHQGGGVAPWNIGRYIFNLDGNSIRASLKSNPDTFDVIFYHFQYVKFLRSGSADIGWYNIRAKGKDMFYIPYLNEVSRIEKMLKETFEGYKTGFTDFKADSVWSFLKIGFKKIFGYNILNFN
jgi:hypothetical protein